MVVSNFSNDNYLIGNDLWVTVNGFANPTKRLKLKLKNLVNDKFYDLVLYPIDNQYSFNITSPVRALFDAPNHQSNPLNTLAAYEINLTAEFVGAFLPEVVVLNKNFIRGWRIQEGFNDNFLLNNSNLIIGKWKDYSQSVSNAVDWDIFNRLKNNQINKISTVSNIIPQDLVLQNYCNYKIIKFLNSLGGYQYQLFETFEIKDSSKPLKNIPKKINNFNETAFISLGTEITREIELYTETKSEDQIIITDLIKSHDVLMWDAEAEFWIKLVPNANTTIFNPVTKIYKNKIKFDFYNEVNNTLLW